MKKTAAHFRFASWSIKNPKTAYIAIAGILVGVLTVGAGTSWFISSAKKGPVSMTNKVVGTSGTFDIEGWKIRRQWEHDGLQCVGYLKESNQTRLTSCYKKVGTKWVFKQSY